MIWMRSSWQKKDAPHKSRIWVVRQPPLSSELRRQRQEVHFFLSELLRKTIREVDPSAQVSLSKSLRVCHHIVSLDRPGIKTKHILPSLAGHCDWAGQDRKLGCHHLVGQKQTFCSVKPMPRACL